MLNQIERREYICKVPSWITRLMKKRESSKNDSNQGGDCGGRVETMVVEIAADTEANVFISLVIKIEIKVDPN